MPVQRPGGEIAYPGILVVERSNEVWNSVGSLYLRHCAGSCGSHGGDLSTQSFGENFGSPLVLEIRKMLDCRPANVLILVAAQTEHGLHALPIPKIARDANSGFSDCRIRIAQKWNDALDHLRRSQHVQRADGCLPHGGIGSTQQSKK